MQQLIRVPEGTKITGFNDPFGDQIRKQNEAMAQQVQRIADKLGLEPCRETGFILQGERGNYDLTAIILAVLDRIEKATA